MRRFSFRLGKLLTLREHQIELLRLQLSELVLAMERLREQERAYSAQVQEVEEALRSLQYPVMFWRSFVESLSFYEQTMAQLKLKREELEKMWREKERELVRRVQEKRVLERFRKRKWESFLHEVNREEQKFLDDLKRWAYA